MSPFYPFTDHLSEHRRLKISTNPKDIELPAPVVLMGDFQRVLDHCEPSDLSAERSVHQRENTQTEQQIPSQEDVDDEDFFDTREIQEDEWDQDTQCGGLPVQVYKSPSCKVSESTESKDLDFDLSILARPCFTFSSPTIDGETDVAESDTASDSFLYAQYSSSSSPVSSASSRSVSSAYTTFTATCDEMDDSLPSPELWNYVPRPKPSWSEEETLGFSGLSEISLFRDCYPDTRTREEKFDKGVPWGLHGRDYVAPLLKKHSLGTTMRAGTQGRGGVSGIAMKLKNVFRRDPHEQKIV